MLKNVMLAIVPLLLMVTTASADDDLLSSVGNLDVAAISDASIDIDEGLGDFDVESLAQQAGGDETDAIEACFRRFGYGFGGYGYGFGGHGFGYGFGHWNYYRPYFAYCYPVFNYYWGCY